MYDAIVHFRPAYLYFYVLYAIPARSLPSPSQNNNMSLPTLIRDSLAPSVLSLYKAHVLIIF